MDPTDSLSRQQRKCLEGVAQGKSSSEIAFDLGIAESTVNGHIEAAVRKLNAPNRRRAAAMLTAGRPIPNPEKVPGNILPVDLMRPDAPVSPPDRVAEERVAFAPPPSIWEMREQAQERTASPLRVLGLIFLIAACLAILLLALDPLSESASKLANRIQAPIVR